MQTSVKTFKKILKQNEPICVTSLVLLWEEARKSEDYVRKLHGKIGEYDYCDKWSNKIILAHKQVLAVYEEIRSDLDTLGAFNPITKE